MLGKAQGPQDWHSNDPFVLTDSLSGKGAVVVFHHTPSLPLEERSNVRPFQCRHT